MPTIPVASSNVQARPLPSGGLETADYGPGIGPGLGSLGKGLEQAAAAQEQVDETFDEAKAKQADNTVTSTADTLMWSGPDAYFGKKNQAAIDAAPVVQQSLDKHIADVRGTLANDRQRWLFDETVGQRRSEWGNAISRHSIEETSSWNKENTGAHAYQAQVDYARAVAAGDDQAAAVARNTLVDDVRQLNHYNGLDGAPAQVAEGKALSDMHASVVENLMTTDPGRANDYYQKHVDEISDPDTRTKLQAALKAPLEAQQADADAQMFRGGAAPDMVPHHGSGAVSLDGNNPGGINNGAFARSQPGYAGSNGRYAAFDTVAHGVAAQKSLLQSYIARGYDTPAKIAIRWAPAGDGGNDPAAYAQDIAAKMGIGVNDRITPAQVDAFATVQAKRENSAFTGAERGPPTLSPGVATSRSSGLPVNAPRDDDLSSQLAAVDVYGAHANWSFERKQAAKQRVMELDSIDHRLKEDQQRQAGNQAWTVALDPRTTSISQIPGAVWANVSPETQRSIMEAVRQNASGANLPPNPDLYIHLSDEAAKGTLTLAEVRQNYAKMPKADFDHFASLAQSIEKGDTAKKVSVETINSIVKNAVQATPGLSTDGLKNSEANAGALQQVNARRYNLQKALVEDVSVWQAHNPGKTIQPQDIQAMADRRLLQTNVGQAAPRYQFETPAGAAIHVAMGATFGTR